MLTTLELEKLKQLIAGKRTPSDGMETHFLRVINGDALPCSPKERERYQYWRQKPGTAEEADDSPEDYRDAICAVRQRDAIIASLEGQMRDKDAVIVHSPLRKVIFLCLGHGESKKFLQENTIADSVKIIDLSHDFRLGDSVNSREFVYGLPELNKESIKKAKNIANPGCFATAIELGLLPLAKLGLLNDVYTTGITGSTGAGQKLQDTTALYLARE